MDNDITFEDRFLLSSTVLTNELPSNMPSLSDFSLDFQTILREFNKSIAFNLDMNLMNLPTLATKEKNLACFLYLTSNRIKKQENILTGAISKKFNHAKNNEFNFIIKQVAMTGVDTHHYTIEEQVAMMFEELISNSKFHMGWDVTANCYINCDLDVHFNRHDFIIYTSDGTEVGTGEVKPDHTSDALIDIDRCRIAESCKKQLHQRLISARSSKEQYTYGVMIAGNSIELSTLNLSNTGILWRRRLF